MRSKALKEFKEIVTRLEGKTLIPYLNGTQRQIYKTELQRREDIIRELLLLLDDASEVLEYAESPIHCVGDSDQFERLTKISNRWHQVALLSRQTLIKIKDKKDKII